MFSFIRNLFKSKQSTVLDDDFVDTNLENILSELMDELEREHVEIHRPNSFMTKSGHWAHVHLYNKHEIILLCIKRQYGGAMIDVDCHSSILIKTCASLVVNFLNNN